MASLDYLPPGIANAAYTFEQFVKSGQEYVIGRVERWGWNLNKNDHISSADLGKDLASINGIAIGPGSDFDRCQIKYSLPVGQGEKPIGNQIQQFAGLEVGHSLLGSMTGPGIILSVSGYGGVAGTTCPHLFPTYYSWANAFWKEGSAALQPFGPDIVDDTVFEYPALEVVLSIGKQLPATWGFKKRYTKSYQGGFTGSGTTEKMQRVIPCFGRKRATVRFGKKDGQQGSIYEIRIAGVYSGGTSTELYERQLAPGAYPAVNTLAGRSTAFFDMDITGCHFLIIYITDIGGGGHDELDYLARIYDES